MSGNGTGGADGALGAAEPTEHGVADSLHHPKPPGSQLLSAKNAAKPLVWALSVLSATPRVFGDSEEEGYSCNSVLRDTLVNTQGNTNSRCSYAIPCTKDWR